MPHPQHISLPIGDASESASIDTSSLPDALVGPVLELFSGKHLDLPIMPTSVARLILACGAECPDLDEISGLVECDPSLTAHILMMANSAGLAPQSAIQDIGSATRRLGTRAIADLAVSNLMQSFAMARDHRRTLQLFSHASVAGVFAYKLGRIIGPARRASLLPGLLNDIGRPIAIGFLHDLRGIVPGSLDESAIEFLAEQLHEAVGIQLVRSWNLPATLEPVIRYHSRPEEAGAEIDLRDAHIAQLANLLGAWTLDPESTRGVVLEEHNAAVALGLSSGQLSELLSVVGEARLAAATFG